MVRKKTDSASFSPSINVYSAAPASNDNIVAGDYDSLGTTAFSTAISYANFSTSGYNDFPLNQAGIASINMTGVTNFGLRDVVADAGDSEPNCPYMDYSILYFYTADNGDNKPKLVVTCENANWVVHLDQVDETTIGTSGNETSRIRYEYDDYGNVTTAYLDGDTSMDSDNATVHRVFHPNTTANILNKVAEERIYATTTADVLGTNLKGQAVYYYDNATDNATPPTKGNLTRLQQYKDSLASVNSTFTYDSYGNRLTTTDANGNNTTWTYMSPDYIYPETKTYPNSLSENYTYDPGTNNLLGRTDVNGQTTNFEWDTFKRLIKVIKPGDSSASPSIEYKYTDWGTIGQQHIEILTKTSGNLSDRLWQKDYFNGLGRVVQVQARGESDNVTIISGTTSYNNRGLVDKEYVAQSLIILPKVKIN